MTVWVVMSTRRAADRLNELVDNGELSAATSLSYQLDSFSQKVKSFCQQNGGSVLLATADRFILNLPVSAAEQVPDLVQNYSDQLKGKLDVGIGLNVSEASLASQMSRYTEEIEFYDPSKDYSDLQKSVEAGTTFDGTPNIFDPQLSDTDDQSDMVPVKNKFQPEKTYMPIKPEKKFAASTAADQQQSNQAYIQAIMQEVGFPAQQPQQQQQPRDLLEALNGGQVQGHAPQQQQPSGEQRQDQAEADVAHQVDEAEVEAEATNQKLARLLAHVKEQLPQIMSLHDKNPDAFKQAMNVISKLVGLARSRNKVSKAEESALEVLEKAIRKRSLGYRGVGRTRTVLPVGSRVGRKRKVLVNGKAVWRSVASGQVKDSEGKAISVISSNAGADNE